MASQKTKKPIRILFDASPLINNHRSGVGYYTEKLVEALAAAYPDDVELTGYYFNFLGRKPVSVQSELPNIHYKAVRFFPGLIISPLGRLTGLQLPIELFIWKKYDHMLFPNFISLPSLRRTPQSVVVHDLGFIDCPEFVHQKNIAYFAKLLPKSLRRAKTVISVSDFTKDRLVKLFKLSAAKIIVSQIPPVITKPAKVDLPTSLTKQGIQANKYILFLGTIEPRKNIIGLVEAYSQLPTTLQGQYSLVLAGGKGWNDDPTLHAIKQAKEQGANIIETGYISEQERLALYSNARLFVLPSHYEGYGMPIIEALAYHLPVAASDIPVFHEIAGDTIT